MLGVLSSIRQGTEDPRCHPDPGCRRTTAGHPLEVIAGHAQFLPRPLATFILRLPSQQTTSCPNILPPRWRRCPRRQMASMVAGRPVRTRTILAVISIRNSRQHGYRAHIQLTFSSTKEATL
jgi:hypothetical protein